MSKTDKIYATVMGRIMPRVAEVFCDQDSTPWVAIKRNGTIMNMRLESQDFAELAIAASMIPDEQEFGSSGFVRPCGDSVIKSVRSAIRLLGRNNQRQMFLRYGCQDGKMLVDLCDDSQTIIEVDEKGWRPTPLKSISPFFRTENEAPLPFPRKAGIFNRLRDSCRSRMSWMRLLPRIFWALPLLFNMIDRSWLSVVHEQSGNRSHVQ